MLIKKNLPTEILDRTTQYLDFQDIKYLHYASCRQMHEFFNSKFFNERIIVELAKKFSYFVAVEGEDNENKLHSYLQKHSSLSAKIITQKINICDAAGREFKNISIFEYAFWAGDTPICKMLLNFLRDAEKIDLKNRCEHILNTGLTFTLNEEVFEKQKPFSLQELLEAYNIFINHYFRILFNNTRAESNLEGNLRIFQAIGLNQSKVTVYIAQHFCTPNLDFDNEQNFRGPITRTIKFRNDYDEPGTYESWFAFPLWDLHVLVKSLCGRPKTFPIPTNIRLFQNDRDALTNLEQKLIRDRQELLQNFDISCTDTADLRL